VRPHASLAPEPTHSAEDWGGVVVRTTERRENVSANDVRRPPTRAKVDTRFAIEYATSVPVFGAQASRCRMWRATYVSWVSWARRSFEQVPKRTAFRLVAPGRLARCFQHRPRARTGRAAEARTSTPPYHGTSRQLVQPTATVFACFSRFRRLAIATGCHGLRPLRSIDAPSCVVGDYCGRVDSHQRSRMPAPKISAPESATIASVAPSKAINA
jgi:hypothetical protein